MTTKGEKVRAEGVAENAVQTTVNNSDDNTTSGGQLLLRLPAELWGVVGDLQYTRYDVPPQGVWDETIRWRDFIRKLQETFATEIEEARALRVEEARASRGYGVGNGWPERAGRALTDRQAQFGLDLARKAGLSEDEAQRRLEGMDAEGFNAFIAEMKAAPKNQGHAHAQKSETPTTCAKCGQTLTPPRDSSMTAAEYAAWAYKKHGGLCWKCRKRDGQ